MPPLKPLLSFLRWVRFIDRAHKLLSKKRMVSNTHADAAQTIPDPKALKNIRVVRQQTEIDYMWVHPQIVEFWQQFLKVAKQRGIPVRAFEMLRSEQRQIQLFNEGRSKVKSGAHNVGCAVDIIHSTKAWELTKKEWDILGAIGKDVARKRDIKIEWGGEWQFYDPAHWQLANWKDYRRAQDIALSRGIQMPEETKKRFQLLEYIIETDIKQNG